MTNIIRLLIALCLAASTAAQVITITNKWDEPLALLVKSDHTHKVKEVDGKAKKLKHSKWHRVKAHPRDIKKLRESAEAVELDFTVTTNAIPNDPNYSQQWGPPKISAPQGWDKATSASNIVVAVMDTGIDYNHPDLKANLWIDPVTGFHGYECLTPGTLDIGGRDDNGHGTHVAGTIGAVGNNGIGVAGVAWNVQLMSLKFLSAQGNGNIGDALELFEKAIDIKASGVNLRIINNSWGGGGYSQALVDTLAAVEAAGILNVIAAGNSAYNTDIVPQYPAAYPNRGIISVQATDTNDFRAYFSNYGLATSDIAAPGHNIHSTWWPSTYKTISGTSMATPHVAGIAALVWSANPGLSLWGVRDRILANADQVEGLMSSTGARVNLAKAMAGTNAVNQFPVVTSFTVTNNTLKLVASDPDNDPLRYGIMLGGDLQQESWLAFPYVNTLAATNNEATFAPLTWTAPATIPFAGCVADGKGGSVIGQAYLRIKGGAANSPPVGTLTIQTNASSLYSNATQVVARFIMADPDSNRLMWSVNVDSRGISHWSCCLSAVGGFLSTHLPAGIHRIKAYGSDEAFNLIESEPFTLRIGNVTNQFPVSKLRVYPTNGTVPLTVTFDFTGSYDPNGTVTSYILREQHIPESVPSTSTKTFTRPGIHRLAYSVRDSEGLQDGGDIYIFANEPEPVVVLPAPTNLRIIAQNNRIVTLKWNDNSDEDRFIVQKAERSGSNPFGNFHSIGTLAANTTGLVTRSPIGNMQFAFRVRACKGSDCSADSNTIIATR